MYRQLNTFWGELYETAVNVDEHDEMVQLQIAMDIFGSTTEIKMAQRACNELIDAVSVYLNVLYGQGIELDEEPEKPKPVTVEAALSLNPKALLSVTAADVTRLSIGAAEEAGQHLRRRGREQYRAKMRESVLLAPTAGQPWSRPRRGSGTTWRC
jgi:hypothetical protein